jgi:hypothetical protein
VPGVLIDVTGNNEFKIAAAKPEALKSQLHSDSNKIAKAAPTFLWSSNRANVNTLPTSW